MTIRNEAVLILLICTLLMLNSFRVSAYTKIEAESYSSMSGVQLENANTTVGWIDAGDWMAYSQVDFGNGPGSIFFSIAKYSVGGSIEIRIDGLSGTLIGTLFPTNTGSWTSFQTQQINIDKVTGFHTLYLVAKDITGVCNIDYFQFSDTKIHVPNWVLSWSDEFNGNAVDESVWSKVWHGNPDNGEVQFYTPRTENIVVSDGTLKLIARVETYTGQGPWMTQPVTRNYTSGKIESQGKKTFKYGKIEARMKLPRGNGSWPAFWMLGENFFNTGVGWPLCGEIDIMEHSQVLDNISGTVHSQAYNNIPQVTSSYNINNYDTSFHVYGMTWSTDQISFYVDDNTYFSVTKATLGNSQVQWPFDQPFWLIFNQAVGGAWGGTPDNSVYPLTTEIDWVRVYQDISTGIDNTTNQNISFNVFPNPATDYITVDYTENEISSKQKYEMILTDLVGKTMNKIEIMSFPTNINLQSYSKGSYLLSIWQGRKLLKNKIIIKN